MGNLVMRHYGQAVEVRDRFGRVHRGVIDGVNQTRGMFIRSGFRRRRFIPFFLIASIFLLRSRRRIF
ncbi:hypothetical protein [Bacillus methanolicus]|uniref:Uncharacterized protein n=1 Tax=Bacillus methanolicus (strain MGA3 / ATCC 53907) TaxID=796606 RepID=I3E991_BACMM|nr:hypothetical protein [Bacillus methanolicus]AIE60316.1 hypothetical protein BMMGA3_09590 [Bacillus methanolicus MGA3]EIJ83062.1 hypothetical protein MGA3_07560 [Bacillus methanolicus MGA3]